MKIVDNCDLSEHNSYRLRAACARAYFPSTEEDVVSVFSEETGRPKVLLGSGHNVILASEYFDADFVILNGTFDRITVDDTVMVAEAGAFSREMSEVACAHSLSGLEVFYDIPSSLGGAVVMNAGASGEEIKDLLVVIRYLDHAEESIKEIDAEAAGLSYRWSIFQDDPGKTVLSARLQLQPAAQADIRAKMNEIKAARWAKQPREYPSAGSVFKRPQGQYVGAMVEAVGLKGAVVGGMAVSDKHAGIMVNRGGGTARDLLKLISLVRGAVFREFGVELELEQRVVGEYCEA